MKLEAEHLRKLSRDIFRAQGVNERDAGTVSDVLVEANLRGHDSHGVVRIPSWVEGLKAGAINAGCAPRLVRETVGSALMDGDRGLGPVVAMAACACAAGKAKQAGIGMVSVHSASHIGMLQYYTLDLAARGLIGMAMTNAEPGMAPHGGIDAVLGTNPLSVAIPGREAPIALDMSTAVAARGKIVLARDRGEEIPPGWAVDSEGNPTTDPVAALEGACLPVGGAKGSGLAIVVDLLTGALAGAAVATGVKGTFFMGEEGTKGDFFLAIDPQAVGEREAFLDRVEELRRDVRASRPAPGGKRIYLPGEPEMACRERRLKDGIPIEEELGRELERLAMTAAA